MGLIILGTILRIFRPDRAIGEKQMKMSLVSTLLTVWALTACAPGGPSAAATATRIAVDLTPPQRAALVALSQNLGLPVDQIQVASTEAVTWPDGCMGVRRLGVMCTQNQVPGFRIVLDARGKQYEFHTDQDGSVVVPVEGMAASGPAQEAAIQQLATNLGLAQGQVNLVSSSAVEWPDSCLGVALEGVLCAQLVTPGYLIVLEAAGRQYEYHAGDDGTRLMPATLAMAWREEGGIGGICKSVVVYRSGEVYGIDCRTESDGRMGTLMELLSTAERESFYRRLDLYGNTVVDLSDPSNVTDRMTRNLDFYGTGSQQPGAAEQQAIYAVGQRLYQQLYQ
jgi:hypothetical protein